VLSKVERSTLMEEVSWRQKSRALWLRMGDKCMKVFHRMANSNRRKNSIDSLLVDGSLFTNQVEISEHIVQFYSNLCTEQSSWELMLDDFSFDAICEVEANWLEREFEEGEASEVAKAMNGDKVQGSITLWHSSKLVGMY
jgi:hypothetical protein